MIIDNLLSVSRFSELVGVSKQAIYKQINNENSKLSAYIVKDGKQIFIKQEALNKVYQVETTNSTDLNPEEATETTENNPISTPEVDSIKPTSTPENQPNNPISTPENQPLNPVYADYIEFLKAEIANLKAEKIEIEQRLNTTINEKDIVIKQQAEQMAQLSQQIVGIADKALMTTSQQQYLSAVQQAENKESAEDITSIDVVNVSENTKTSFWKRLFK